jgi:hypothetical protein
MAEYKDMRSVVGKTFVFRSTEGYEQELFSLLSDLVKNLQDAPPAWHPLINHAMELKDKALEIGKTLESDTSSESRK